MPWSHASQNIVQHTVADNVKPLRLTTAANPGEVTAEDLQIFCAVCHNVQYIIIQCLSTTCHYVFIVLCR